MIYDIYNPKNDNTSPNVENEKNSLDEMEKYINDEVVATLFEIKSLPSTLTFYNFITTGTLVNGATVGSGASGKYVSYIGGKSDGYALVTANIAIAGSYNLNLLYRHGDSIRPMTLDINGVNTNTIYMIPGANPGVFNIQISLNSGKNTIKFHGDGTNYAPDLGMFYLTQIVPRTTPQLPLGTYDLSFGTLANGATLGIGMSAQYASNLGGTNDGSTTINVNVDSTQVYKIFLNYINPDNSIRAMRINVNGVETGSIYAIPSATPGTFATMLTLNSGNNVIKFHGDGVNSSPSLKIMAITIPTPNTIPTTTIPNILGPYNLSNGILTGGSKIVDSINNVLGWIGGPSDGASTVTIPVSIAGVYNLSIKYIDGDGNRPLKIDVNGVVSTIIYKTPKTNSWNSTDASLLIVSVSLNIGTNTIKFHGDGTNYAADFISFTATLGTTTPVVPVQPNVPVTLIFNALNGTLAGGAKIDAGINFAGWLGGPTDGSTSLSVKVNNGGVYNLLIQYISGDTNRPLKIDINGINTGSIYRVPITNGWTINNTNLFILPITLAIGTNVIKFHGDGTNYAPSIGGVIITNTSTTQKPITNTTFNIYNIGLGTVANGSILNSTVNFITGLGGSTDGSVTITANALSFGLYNFIMEYLSVDNSRPFKIDVNGVNTGTIYMCQKTNSLAYSDALNFIAPITLNQGSNTIKIHGDGKNPAPYVGMSAIWLTNVTQNFSTGMTPTQIILNGSAGIINGLFTGIAGVGNGEVDISIYVPYTGFYDFAIDYVASYNTNKVQISINGVSTGTIYSFDATQSMNIVDEKRKIIQLQLVAGNNMIKIF